MSTAAMKQAREALENHPGNYKLTETECRMYEEVVNSLRAAIEEAEKQEPVAHITGVNAGYFIAAPINRSAVLSAGMALYAHPQPAVNLANVSACPWCGQRGPDYDEAEKPSDYCHHDPVTTTGSPYA